MIGDEMRMFLKQLLDLCNVDNQYLTAVIVLQKLSPKRVNEQVNFGTNFEKFY